MTTYHPQIAVAVAMVALGLATGGLVLSSFERPATDLGNLAMNVPLAIAFPGVAAVIARHHPGHLVAWIFAATGLGGAMTLFTFGYAQHALEVAPGTLPAGVAVGWLSEWVWTTGVMPLVTLGVLFFPDGRLPSWRWRPAAAVALAAVVLVAVSHALRPGPLSNHPVVDNPVGVIGSGRVLDVLGGVGFALFVSAFLMAALSVFARWRRSTQAVRRQLRWLLYAVGALGVGFGLETAVPSVASVTMATAALVFLPVAVGIAIVREGLYDIDVLISRSLVYGILTIAVVGTYVMMVSVVGGLLGPRAGVAGGLVVTAIVAVVFQPARVAVQRRVSRWVYGDRADTYVALSGLARRLESAIGPNDVLPAVVQTVATTLRLPYVAIELTESGSFRPVASHGEVGPTTSTLLLTHQGETLGRLILGTGSRALSGSERKLLEDLARQVGFAVHGVRLTAELQRSREQLILAREEERRRLHRDLHDGLGPLLAALTLQLDVLRRQVRQGASTAEALSVQLKADVQSAIAEVRRLVFALRPPALEELGLVSALQQQAIALSATPTMEVTVEANGVLPLLPAATEVAAYRIATEAVTNAVRHSGGQRCRVRIHFNGLLHVEVEDDGSGIPAIPAAGVGLASMRERAAELGGHCTVQPNPGGGTVVRASLPVIS